MEKQWDMLGGDDLVACFYVLNGHVDRHIDRSDGVHDGYGVGQRNYEGRMLIKVCLEKELCMLNTWFKREGKNGENEIEIDSSLIRKVHRRFLRNVMAMPGEFQHV